MSAFLLAFLAGAAHAAIAAVFALAGIGKLFACRQGARSLCHAAARDCGLVIVALLPWPPAQVLTGAAALAVGAGGWALERLRQGDACRCFGLMNLALHRFRNLFRLGLAVAGAILLAAATREPAAPAAAASWQGVACALAAVLLTVAHALGRLMVDSRLARTGGQPARTWTGGPTLDPGQRVGQWPDGRAATLDQLLRGDQPLALLFSLRGCADCDSVKAELLPHAATLPFALHVLEKGAREPAAPCLADTDGALRRRLGIASYPALVVVDPRTFRVAAPLALGADAIRHQLLQLVLARAAAPLDGVSDGGRQYRRLVDGH